MAEIGKERWGQYKRNVLEILRDHPEGLHWKDLFAELDKIMPANEFENASYESSGMRRRPYIVRFSTIALVKAGWLLKEKGFWTITEEGKQALVTFKTPDEIQHQSSLLYNEWRSGQPEDESDPVQNRAIELVASIEEAEDNAMALITQYLGSMDPYQFQNLIGALLEGMDYHVSWISPPGKDGGIDIIAFQDPLGATGRRIKVQVKRRADKAGAESLRSFLGVLSDDDIGLYICTGGFSSDAERTARESETKRLTLLDAKGLFTLWVEYYEKLPQASRALMPLKPIYHLDLPK
jgi:restriction system protein